LKLQHGTGISFVLVRAVTLAEDSKPTSRWLLFVVSEVFLGGARWQLRVQHAMQLAWLGSAAIAPL
jgi:hypothetical protein